MSQAGYGQIWVDAFWRQNTGLVVLLGLCPLLAVTNTVVNAIGLGLATTLTLVATNLAVSLARRSLRPAPGLPSDWRSRRRRSAISPSARFRSHSRSPAVSVSPPTAGAT